MEQRRPPPSRVGPVIWGTIAFVLVAAIGVSFLLSRQALGDAKDRAGNRAEEYTDTVLRPALTPELTAEDITGASYRDLIARVQEGVLSDDRVVRVRIWKPDGDLIFSSDQRDEVGSVFEPDDVRIEQAAADQTVSTVTGSEVPTASGLGGSSERLLEIFVPLNLENELSTSGVVQIDHRYAPIEEEVTRVWRPTQLGLAAALGVSVLLLGITLRGRRRPEPAPAARPERVAPVAAGADGARVRQAEERAAAAERAAREAEHKLALVEKRLTEMKNAGTAVSASVATRVEDLELRLRMEEEERRRLEEEAQRTRSVLARKEAELEQAGAEVQRLVGLLSKRESERAAEADPELASKLATATAELQSRVRELEDQRRKDVSELQRAQEMLVNTQLELTEAARKLKAAEVRMAELEAGAAAPALEEAAPELPAPTRARHRGGRRARKERAPVEAEAPTETVAPREEALEAPEAPPEQERPAEPREPERPVVEEEEEGLSLRERLTRAAAARHRTIGKPDAS